MADQMAKQLSIAIGLMIAASLYSTMQWAHAQQVSAIVRVALLTAAGPMSGWAHVLRAHTQATPHTLLWLVTGAILALVLSYLWLKRMIVLLVAAAFWWSCGFYFATGF